jgi:hypothetical protein
VSQESIFVSFISRKNNIAAYGLVDLAKSIGTKNWMGIVSNQIHHIICFILMEICVTVKKVTNLKLNN